MQTLLILSLLIAVWLDRDSAPKRKPSDSKVSDKSTGLERHSSAEAHRFRRWVGETYI